MIAFLSLWGHAIAALVFGVAALVLARGGGRPRVLLLALAVSAIWAVTAAGSGPRSDPARIAESLRNLAWLGFMATLLREAAGGERRQPALMAVYVAVGATMLLSIAVTVLLSNLADVAQVPLAARRLAATLRMVAATGALLLVHQLYGATVGNARGPVRAAIWAIAAMWIYDLNLYAIAYLDQFPDDVAALRGPVSIGIAAALLLAVHKGGEWRLQLSRSMAWQTLSVAALALYLFVTIAITSLIGVIGGEVARVAQTAFVFGTGAAALALLPGGKARAWFRVKLAKHLFAHRYDYRLEWIRFTDTLGAPEHAAAPLPQRVVKAVADIMLAPAGLLYVPDGTALVPAAGWNWPDEDMPLGSLQLSFGEGIAARQHIVELDALRAADAPDEALEGVPQVLIDTHRAWAVVPLIHVDRLAGLVVLARPPIDRALDWEDFDLLRVVGRQIASYLAERQGQRALDDARRFEEFNRRFAFVMHDIKNLVSQLSLVARNAERHADNPEFRADMVATLKDSADKMNSLLARLAQHNSAIPDEPRATDAGALVAGLAEAHTTHHPVQVGRAPQCVVMADPARLEKLLGHLVQNAIEASAPGVPVRIELRRMQRTAAIDVIDSGCGMTPEFVREKLFAPFASTKPHGFGVGAHEALRLAQSMGGSIDVTSRPAEGSCFTVTLPLAADTSLEEAA